MNCIDSYKKYIKTYETPPFNKLAYACNNSKLQVIFHKGNVMKQKKYKFYTYAQSENRRKYFKTNLKQKNRELIRYVSMPDIRTHKEKIRTLRTRSSDQIKKNIACNQFETKLVINFISEFQTPFGNQPRWKIYRCQLSSKEESCCCSCNSDAMFEVMKSLYDCYKKKNCDHCNCILCGHFPREEREQAMIRKSMADLGMAGPANEENVRKAKAAGFLTPHEGKSPEEKERILRGRAMHGLPLPEGKTPSDKKVIEKIRGDLALPPEPKSSSVRQKHHQAANEGLLQPLEGKTPEEKEKILRGLADRGIPLPEGRTPSEKALIAKFKAKPSRKSVLAEKIRKSKVAEPASGLLTPLTGKTPEEKEKIIKGLAMAGLPRPEAKTPSEHKLIEKVHADLGLPPSPKTPSLKEKHEKAAKEGILQPLEGKTPAEKEKILRGLQAAGIPLPEGRTPSEKALIDKIKAEAKPPSEKTRKSKVSGLMTPLAGKTPAERDKILKGLAMAGHPLPSAKSPSEQKHIDKVHADLGLPPPPKTPSLKEKHEKAAKEGILQPLEGKTPAEKEKILRGLQAAGLPLPEGRTPSEKALVAKIKAEAKPPSEKSRKSKAPGLMTPLAGKSPAERDKILKGLAMAGHPLPSAKSPSEQIHIDKVHAELGLPPPPKTPSLKEKHQKAAKEGILQPLEGKSPAEKEKILRGLQAAGLPLPEGRTPSEKALVAKIKAEAKPPSEKTRKSKAPGLMTPLAGKTPAERDKILKGLAMAGHPLPSAKSPSEQKHIEKVHADLGLPPPPKTPSLKEKHEKAAKEGILQPLEGKTPAEKEKILRGLQAAGLPLPEGRTPSEKALIAKIKAEAKPPSEKSRKSKAPGLMTPLAGKTPAERDKILKGLAMAGHPLPSAKSPSEQKHIDKVHAELGLPPPPKTPSLKEKHEKAAKEGLLQPLEGKTPAEKEKILRGLQAAGLPLPEGRTPSEKALIAEIKAEAKPPSVKSRKSKAPGLMTPLAGKTPAERDKILKELAMAGHPLPSAKSPSEQKHIDKVHADLGLPPPPKTPSLKEKHEKAAKEGLLQPLEGKTPAEKEKILRGLAAAGLPLPEGRTPSEKALIAKIKAEPLEKLRKSGLVSTVSGKPSKKITEGPTPSEKALPTKEKIKTPSIGPEKSRRTKPVESAVKSKTPSQKEKKRKEPSEAGLPLLEGKTPSQKIKTLQDLADKGIPLPEAKTPSEKALISKVRAGVLPPTEGPKSEVKIRKRTTSKAVASPPLSPEERRKLDEKTAKDIKEGTGPADECICDLLAPEKSSKSRMSLEGKTPEQKERILRGLVRRGIPLPEGKTPSEKKILAKIRAELGLPPEPRTPSMKVKYAKAHTAGLLTPLEGKSPTQKERTLRGLFDMGVPLPEGRTPSEKALIASIRGNVKLKSKVPSIPSEKPKKVGLLSPLDGKTPEQKEKIIRGLIKGGFPIPEGRTPSEKALIAKVKLDLKTPETPSEKMRKARPESIVAPEKLPLAKEKSIKTEGKPPDQREEKLRALVKAGLPLPEPKSPSDAALISKIRKEFGLPPEPDTPSLKEKHKKAHAAGVIVPLEGKTPAEKESILKKQLKAGIPLPEGRSPSEKTMIRKLKTTKEKPEVKKVASPLTILAGKTPSQKEKHIRDLVKAGVLPPEGKTPSEKSLISRVRKEKLEPKPATEKEPTPVKAKAGGLLTPLKGKTPEQKEKLMRTLAMLGHPLPENTDSERRLADKIRLELGLPPSPKTPSERERYDHAQAAGLILPLEGKTPEEKERILIALANMGIPLPEGRTPSEKALIMKIKADLRPPVPSEKLGKAKAAGLLTPLQGKTPAEKEKILRGLVAAGLPLPEGTTPSDKSIVRKIRAEISLIPTREPERKISKAPRAKAEGLLTPLAGKTPAEKEKILRGLVQAGLPLPEGKTSSEKDLIKKIKAEFEIPTKATPSRKKEKVKGASKKVSAELVKKEKSKAVGIGEEFEDIIKTTTCDRGCGCDKKKIRFKHSYVRIRVTSPDISSLCPCPDECIPGVKSGIITDNEGIKVTIGSAVGVPSYSCEYIYINNEGSNTEVILRLDDDVCKHTLISSSACSTENTLELQEMPEKMYDIKIYNENELEQIFPSDLRPCLFDEEIKSNNEVCPDMLIKYLHGENGNQDKLCTPQINSYGTLPDPELSTDSSLHTNSNSGHDSILVSKTESSLSLTSSSNLGEHYSGDDEIDKISSTYFIHNIQCPLSESNNSQNKTNLECFYHPIEIDKKYVGIKPRYTFFSDIMSENAGDSIERMPTKCINNKSGAEFLILRLCQTQQPNMPMGNLKKRSSPIMVIDHLNSSDHDLMGVVEDILTKGELFSDASLIMIVPSYAENDSDIDSIDSTICLQMSVNSFELAQKNAVDPKLSQDRLVDYEDINRYENISKAEEIACTGDNLDQLERLTCQTTQVSYFKPEDSKTHCHKRCQVRVIRKPVVGKHQKAISMDTTEDRPCNCPLQESKVNDQCVANVVSEFLTPVMAQGACEDLMYIDESLPVRPSVNQYSSDTFIRVYQMPPRQHPAMGPCLKPQMQRAPPKYNQLPQGNFHSGCDNPHTFPHPCFCGPRMPNNNSSNKRVTYRPPDGCQHTKPSRFRGNESATPETKAPALNSSKFCDNINACNHHIQYRQMKSKLTETESTGIKLCMSKNTSTTGCSTPTQPPSQDQSRKGPADRGCQPNRSPRDVCGQPLPPPSRSPCALAASIVPPDAIKGFKLQISAKGPNSQPSKECN